MAEFASVQAENARPRLVTLEASTGWGKTRVVQSFYARLAAEQTSRYWPRFITGVEGPLPGDTSDGGRKLIFPVTEHVVPEDGALPEYFWWGLTATRRQAGLLPVRAIVQDLDQFVAHSAALDGRFKAIASLSERAERSMRRNAREVMRDVASSAGGSVVDAAIVGAGAAAGLSLGPIGVGVGMTASLGIAGLLRARKELAAAPSVRDALPFGTEDDDLIGAVGEELVRLARHGIPLVIAVEDVHTADRTLVELLLKLLTGPAAPVLVVATSWPSLLDEPERAAHRLVAGVPESSVVRRRLSELHKLELEERSELARQVLMDSGSEGLLHAAEPLARHFDNPLALKLAVRMPRMQRLLATGDLDAELTSFPQDVDGVFRLMWAELPTDLRDALTLAVLSSPVGVPTRSGRRLLEGASWDPSLISAAATATPWLADQVEMLERRLGDESEAYGWSRRVNEWLRTFLERAQQEVAEGARETLCGPRDLDTYYETLAGRIDLSEELDEDRRMAAAELLVTLALEGYISWTSDAERAGDLVIERLSGQEDVTSLRRVVALADAIPASEDGSADVRMRLRCRALGKLGRPADAVAGLRELIERQEHALGPTDPRTLASRREICWWYGESGDLTSAIGAVRRWLDDQRPLLGDTHADVLSMRNVLAFWSARAGELDAALEEYRGLIADRERTSGPEHRDTLTARNDYAYWSGVAGDVQWAVEEFHRLLEIRERVLSREHPDTLTTRDDLAHWSGRMGDEAGAIRQYRSLVADRTRVLGADHPFTLTTRRRMGVWIRDSGDASGAVEEFEALLAEQLRVHGSDHPFVMWTRHDLALSRAAMGQVPEALEELQRLLGDQSRVLGDDHTDTRWTRDALTALTEQHG